VTIKSGNENYIVFPNPAYNQITVTSDRIPIKTIKILTITGKTCVQKQFFTNSNSIKIELPDLPAGIYSLQVNDVIKKLVIDKR
jgi:hypothetical protein